MEWIETITDRKIEDVERVALLMAKQWNDFTESEKNAWITGMKGALNIVDLERVQNNIKYISKECFLDLIVSDVPDIPTSALFDEILSNIQKIKNIGCSQESIPLKPLNRYEKWNSIEQILFDTYKIISSIIFNYTGEIFAGTDIGLLL